VRGTLEQRETIDAAIEAAAPAWPLALMARIDKSILRLALYEMLHVPEVPPRVAINEAVELAKRYGSTQSAQFVNGILDKFLEGHSK
jgi:N utilization substance protein B